MAPVKQLPYGISDFKQLRRENLYFVDKTMYLPVMEDTDHFTNTVLNEEGEAIYHGLTHASGFYRETFKQYKPTFSRILMMGVSPVTMDDLNGRLVNGKPVNGQIYLMRATDRNGQQHTLKVIKK